MSIPNATPVVMEDAFTAAQIAALRDVLAQCRSLMAGERRRLAAIGRPPIRANSVGFEALWLTGREDLLDKALSVFLNSRAHDFAVEQFPAGYCFLLRNCSVRYHDPAWSGGHLDLHFDANFLGLGGKAVNVWVPLETLGDGVPGLTFLSPEADGAPLYRAWKSRYDAAVARNGIGAPIEVFFARDQVEALCARVGAATFVTPRLAAGGFIAFHQLVVHATESVPGTARPRGSMEFRIAGTAALPDRYRNDALRLGIPCVDGPGRRSVEITADARLAG